MFDCVMQALLAGRARDGATPSKWPTERTSVGGAGHCGDIAQAFDLKQMH